MALIFLLAGPLSATAQEYRGTTDQQAACTPDVFRLCWNDIPSYERIVACLKREKPRLSEACRAVFNQDAGGTKYASNHRLRRHHHRERVAEERRYRPD
jgi:hypothetical protein